MKVPISWLADYVALEMPVEELAYRLTMAGLKVEAIHRIGETWTDVVIGEVLEIESHPSSRKPLWVTRTDLGGGRVETIVTGAPNVRLGDKIPVIPVGGVVPHGPEGEAFVIEPRPMAGITSHGMLASARELGISDEHEGIYILPPEAPVGAPLRSFLGDDVLEIETNPNRPDTMSIIGVAREVAAITEQQLTLPDPGAITGPVEWLEEPSIPVDVESPESCPRYSALRIDGVSVGPSPAWMQQRLQAAGTRAINLLVDISNYVMLEYGQPTHAFDASDLEGGCIVVRHARPNETLRTLDGVERELSPEDLVIADGQRAVGIAGVMGGENSEIGDGTHSIVLESANFSPTSVRRTAKRLDLRTEASSRFERDLPPEQTVLAIQRYLQLLAQLVRGPLRVFEVSDVWVGAPTPRLVVMPMRDVHRLLGIPVTVEDASDILSRLGFDVTVERDAISAVVPFWRRADIALSADLVEEVARIIGFDAVPSTLPLNTVPPPAPVPALQYDRDVRENLRSFGVSELVTHSLTSPPSMGRLFQADHDGHAGPMDRWAQIVVNPAGVYAAEAETLPVSLLNPPNRDRSILRMTLLPSLLDEVARNLRHADERVAFFEIGRTYFRRPAQLPYERRSLGIALSGRRTAGSWQDPAPAAYSFYDVKGMLVALLNALQVGGWEVSAVAHPYLHPGRGAALHLRGREVALFGELHPLVGERFEIQGWPVQVAEIDLDSIYAEASRTHLFRPIPRHPAARRDVAVVVPLETAAESVLRTVRQAGGSLVERASIFDVYAGEPLPPGSKSIAVALEFRAPGQTLTQEEVADSMEKIVSSVERDLNATIRE
jgi:phenylalanyl-tRNA synthetase beta chain